MKDQKTKMSNGKDKILLFVDEVNTRITAVWVSMGTLRKVK